MRRGIDLRSLLSTFSRSSRKKSKATLFKWPCIILLFSYFLILIAVLLRLFCLNREGNWRSDIWTETQRILLLMVGHGKVWLLSFLRVDTLAIRFNQLPIFLSLWRLAWATCHLLSGHSEEAFLRCNSFFFLRLVIPGLYTFWALYLLSIYLYEAPYTTAT